MYSREKYCPFLNLKGDSRNYLVMDIKIETYTEFSNLICKHFKAERETCRAGVPFDGIKKGDPCPFEFDHHHCSGFEFN